MANTLRMRTAIIRAVAAMNNFFTLIRAHQHGIPVQTVGPARKSSIFGHMINALLTMLVRSRWLGVGLVLFGVFAVIFLHIQICCKIMLKAVQK